MAEKIGHYIPVSCCMIADAGGPACACATSAPKPKLRYRARQWWHDRREALALRIAPWLRDERE